MRTEELVDSLINDTGSPIRRSFLIFLDHRVRFADPITFCAPPRFYFLYLSIIFRSGALGKKFHFNHAIFFRIQI